MCKVAGLKNAEYKKHADNNSKKVGAPAIKTKSPAAKAIPVCSKCFTVIGKGQNHKCDKTQRCTNISEIVRKTSQKSRSKITAKGLKSVAEEKGVSTRGGTLDLKTGSKPLQVKIGASKVQLKPAYFSHENMKRLQTSLNLSDRATL